MPYFKNSEDIMSDQLKKFYKGLDELGISLTEEQMNQFVQYYELLIEKNKVMNLTTITDFDEVVEKHFLDSLSIVKVMDLTKVSRVMDIGSGAGFPGIPLKIVFPHLKMVMVDSVNKKVTFINECIDQIGLSNAKAVHGRVEDLGHDANYRESNDLVVSRAVASLDSLSEFCLPFVRVGGDFISYKSGKVDEELTNGKKAITVLGGKLVKDIRFQIPNTDMERAFLVIHKVKPCGKKYPRKAGTPKKSPIR